MSNFFLIWIIWNHDCSPDTRTAVVHFFHTRRIFLTQGWNPGLPHLQPDSLSAEPQGDTTWLLHVWLNTLNHWTINQWMYPHFNLSSFFQKIIVTIKLKNYSGKSKIYLKARFSPQIYVLCRVRNDLQICLANISQMKESSCNAGDWASQWLS